ncbi:MAG TPA: phage terminase large subunit [Acidocella sp.]|nr:phage terminase large subunit [Acidocella sp.]
MRGWDLAATEKTEHNDPDWTAGCRIGRSPEGVFYVLDQIWERGSPQKVRDLIKNTASQDGKGVAISLPQDPAQAGKSQALDFVKMLTGYRVSTTTEARNTSDQSPTPSKLSAKITRFSPFSAQAEGGNVKILRGPWNTRFFEELEAFPDAKHDDCPDSVSRAFAGLIAPPEPPKPVRLNLMAR